MEKKDFKEYQKPVEGILTSYFARPFSRKVTSFVADMDCVTPNLLTFGSLVLGVFGSLLWLKGGFFYAVIGTIIFHFGYILDCSDGELARYRGIKSRFGEALDPICDRILEILLIFCATLLAIQNSDSMIWYYIGFFAVCINFLFEYIDVWLNRIFTGDGRFEKKKRFFFISPHQNLSYREIILYILPFSVCIGLPGLGLSLVSIGGAVSFPIQFWRLWKRVGQQKT